MKRIYIDMDQTLCNFKKAAEEEAVRATILSERDHPQSKIGFFLFLEPIEGAIESVRALEKQYDVWILSRPSFHNVHCYTEKALWIQRHLGFEMQKKLILCGNKSLVKGDYLIDDSKRDGQTEFEGKHMWFGSKEYPDWKSVIDELIPQSDAKGNI